MSLNLTAQDLQTIRSAAYGAVSLLAAASPKPHRAATNGSIALYSATGEIGHILAAKTKDITLRGKNTAELADQVFPALTASVSLLQQQDPAEAANFRDTVLTAVAAATPVAHPTTTAMTQKINAALVSA
ncbi:hypothetical protein [Nocardia sp. NPDC004722]